MLQLYDDQKDVKNRVYSAWDSGANDVCMVMPTGSGKTATFTTIIREVNTSAVAIAHRQEIVTQISLALARNDVVHNIIAPPDVVRLARNVQLLELKRNYINCNAKVTAASVDTLINKHANDPVFSANYKICDEGHHMLRRNKWGRVWEMFTRARGLGPTATPCRADGFGLGRHADGYYDELVVGLTMRELIDKGRLCDYRLFCPPTKLDLDSVGKGADGDYKQQQLAKVVHESTIVGDVVREYCKHAYGKRGITFAVNVEEAGLLAHTFREAGVPAEVVSAKTPGELRVSILRRFAAGELWQLVNVDLFGEGFDVPAVEVVSFARPTESYSLYCQQFGRALRVFAGKSHALIIDHVGNVVRHGLPDRYVDWSLDRREKRSKAQPNQVPLKVCPECTRPYEKFLVECPYCGHRPVPALRSGPEWVDGDLFELDAATLAKMRGEIERPMLIPYGASDIVVNAIRKRHRERNEAQAALRDVICAWAGRITQRTDELAIRELQKRFYLSFGVDVLTAQTLNREDTVKLTNRIIMA